MPTIFTRGAASARGFGLFGGAAADPNLWSWGYNAKGQLGLGNTTNYSSPKGVGALATWSTVSVGGRLFSLAVKTDGTLWSWGYNNNGQLGLGDVTNRSSPVQVGALTTWSKIAAGYLTSFAIKTDGTMWSWGAGSAGGLGLGNTTSYSSPKQIGALTTWATVTGSQSSAVAVKTDGTMWSWGSNTRGQLGLGNTTTYYSPKQIGALTTWSKLSASGSTSFAIKTNGTMWSWGNNPFGQLGLGTSGYGTYRSSPVQVGALTTWNTVNVGKNGTNTIANKTDGTMWSWGGNAQGQLGLGNTTAYSSPKQIGALTTWATVIGGTVFFLAIKTNGSLWAWGQNNIGQLGLGNTTYYSSPKQVGALTWWSSGSAGNGHALALKT